VPFCTSCGTAIDASASFCSKCGAAQPRRAAAVAPINHDFLDGINERTASILCYIPVFGAIPAIVFLASQRFRGNQRVRFNAFQSVYLFVAWLIISSAVPVILWWAATRGIQHLLELGLIGCWIYLLIKASHQEQVRLPIIGELAARSATEQL
jgi:uncharacterized membrane protein